MHLSCPCSLYLSEAPADAVCMVRMYDMQYFVVIVYVVHSDNSIPVVVVL